MLFGQFLAIIYYLLYITFLHNVKGQIILDIKNINKLLENSFKTTNISINDMDKFEEKELTKKRIFT